jgi:hypothetical protein
MQEQIERLFEIGRQIRKELDDAAQRPVSRRLSALNEFWPTWHRPHSPPCPRIA